MLVPGGFNIPKGAGSTCGNVIAACIRGLVKFWRGSRGVPESVMWRRP